MNALCINLNFREFVRLGEWNTSSPIDCSEDGVCADPAIDIHDIDEIIVHEKFVRGQNGDNYKNVNDIVLIRLGKKVNYSDFIRPICIPTNDLADSFFDGANLVEASWGETSTGKIIQ